MCFATIDELSLSALVDGECFVYSFKAKDENEGYYFACSKNLLS